MTETRELRRFFALTFALSWGIGGALLLARSAWPALPADAAWMAASFGPGAAALILARDRRALLGTLVRRAHWAWWLAALLFLPAIMLGLAFGGGPVAPRTIAAGLPLFLLAHPFANPAPFGEELGWRGYALPRLLARMHPLAAALALEAVRIAWHLPAFLIPGAMAAGLAGFGWWALASLALSVAMTFLYLRANGNALVAGVLPHWIIDGASASGAWTSRPAEALALAAFALLLAPGLRRGPGRP